MRHIKLQDSWYIDAPRERIYNIITDFENYPQYFPTVTKSVRIVDLVENDYKIEAQLKSFGRIFDVKMEAKLKPCYGFTSQNYSTFGTSGKEVLELIDEDGGTRLNYIYELDIHKPLLRFFAKPLIGWFAMKSWEKAVIKRVREIVLSPAS